MGDRTVGGKKREKGNKPKRYTATPTHRLPRKKEKEITRGFIHF